MSEPKRKGPKFRKGQVVRVWRPTGVYEFEKVESYVDEGSLIRFASGSLQCTNLCFRLTDEEIGPTRKET